ncbi:MAG: DUF4382 domain-containing protein [Pseudomonadota bacterium]
MNNWTRLTSGIGALFAAGLLLAGCGGSSGSGGDTGSVQASGDSGSVAVLITDAPTDVYDEIRVTFTRISLLPREDSDDAEAVVLFEDADGETLDLLQLRDHAELFTVQEDVPVGDYEKVRMEVSGVELVDLDTDPETRVSARLPGDRLDLVPRAPLAVSDDNTLYLELDVDADESLLVIEADGDTVFRPVVFVTAYEEGNDDSENDGVDDGLAEDEEATDDTPLISVGGQVRDADGDMLLICPSDRASTSACVRTSLEGDVPVFDRTGEPAGQVDSGDALIAMGLLRRDADGHRTLEPLSITLGSRPTLGTRGGTADSAVDEERGFVTRSGREIRLQEAAPVVSPQGERLDSDAIAPGQPLTAFGIVSGEPMRATLVVLGSDALEDDASGEGAGRSVLRGELVAVDTDNTLQVEVNGTTEQIRLVEDGRVVIAGQGRVASGAVADLGEYERVRINARGAYGDSYFEAEQIVAHPLNRDDDASSNGRPDDAGAPEGVGPPDHAGPPDGGGPSQ